MPVHRRIVRSDRRAKTNGIQLLVRKVRVARAAPEVPEVLEDQADLRWADRTNCSAACPGAGLSVTGLTTSFLRRSWI